MHRTAGHLKVVRRSKKRGGALRAPSQIVLRDLQAAKPLVQRTRMLNPI